MDVSKRLRELEEQLEKNRVVAEKFNDATRSSKVQENIKEKERLKEEIDFLQGYMNMGKSNIPFSGYFEFGIWYYLCQSICWYG